MCGRFSQDASAHASQALMQALGVAPTAHAPTQARYNLALSQAALAAVGHPHAPKRRAQMLRFGIHAGASIGLVFNARAETVARKPLFRGLLHRHRCLVVATGFYEWQPATKGGHKVPWYFCRADGAPFCFAALRGAASSPGAADAPEGACPEGFVLVTTAANAVVAGVHGRMPVMLDADEAIRWLDPDTPSGQALGLLQPYGGPMRAYPVDCKVNNARYDAPDCAAPL